MTQLKSNSMTVSADSIRSILVQSEALALESIDLALEAGKLLVVAKDESGHGQWLPFLKRVGIPERKAQRYMKLARSGFKSDTLSDLGGIRATLEFLALRRLPDLGKALSITCHSDIRNPPSSELGCFIWQSEVHPGYYYVASFRCESALLASHVTYTKRAISGDDILTGDGRFKNSVWALVERHMVIDMANWHFYHEDEEVLAAMKSHIPVENDIVANVLAA